MKRVILGLVLVAAPISSMAEVPTAADIQQAGAATSADFAALVVNLRAQLVADQREIASLQAQIAQLVAAAKKTPEDQKKP